jgi:hypothetical protein
MIDAYEGVCRILDDALRLIFHLSTERGIASVSASDFKRHELAQSVMANLPAKVGRATDLFAGTPWEAEVQELVGSYGGIRSAEALFDVVLSHHEKAQRGKPPDGKRPWFGRDRHGIVVRPTYADKDLPPGDDSYVHWYRTGTATTFLQDLGRLPR